MSPSPADRAEQAVARLLRSAGVRFTTARRLVVRALAGADGPLAAAEIHRGLTRDIPLSSLYRSLAVLEGAGVLAKQHDDLGVGRFELAEWLTGHHHHVVCDSCGEVRDVAVPEEDRQAISSLARRLAARAGYRASGHRFDIQGTCRACRGH